MTTEPESRYVRIGLVVDSACDSLRDFLDQYNDASKGELTIDFTEEPHAIKLQSPAVA